MTGMQVAPAWRMRTFLRALAHSTILGCGASSAAVISDASSDASAPVPDGALIDAPLDAPADASSEAEGGDAGCFALPQLYDLASIVVQKGVPYASGGVPHVMDTYSPPGAGPFPVLVQVHGGGFVSGDKSTFAQASSYYATRGIVAIAIDYTLAAPDGGKPSYPAAPQDVFCAIRSVRASAGALHVDPARLALRGGSAGATLVNMVALAGAGAPFNGGCDQNGQSVSVQAVIDYFGASDFEQPISGDPSGGIAFFGPDASPATIAAASPIHYLSSAAPPYVIGHGTADTTVYPAQSEELRGALLDAGVEVHLVEVQGAPHGFIQDFEGAYSRQVRCEEEALLSRVLKPGT